MYRKYTDEQISNMIQEYGFKLIEYITTTNIIAQDKDGYKYKLNISNLKLKRIPSKWMKNPYATDNIRLYMKINNPNYIWLGDKYSDCKIKEKFICLKHKDKGIQLNTFDNIINNNHICKYCGYEKLSKQRVTAENVLKELCEECNVIYYGRFSKKHETYIKYICPNHKEQGIQSMSLTHFKESKIPCRYCNITKGELKIQSYLINNNIKFETQKSFEDCKDERPLKFDFYLPDKRIAIEYDGQQHYYPIQFSLSGSDTYERFISTLYRDNLKNNYCIDNNIYMIRIPYWEYNNIEKILDVKI